MEELKLQELSHYLDKINISNIGGNKAELELTKISSEIYELHVAFNLDKTIFQDEWQLIIHPSFKPSFNWAPHLTPKEGMVADQHSFKSPGLIASDDNKMLIMIPKIELIDPSKAYRWYMDSDAENNQLILGTAETQVKGHVFFEKKLDTKYEKGNHQFGCYLIVTDDPEKIKNPFRLILAFLWENHGSKLYAAEQPIKGEMDHFIRYTYDWAFDKWKDAVWQEFTLNNVSVGAPTFIVNYSQSPNYDGVYFEREDKSIWNQAWFSSLRSAIGMYKYAVKTDDEELLDKARKMKRLALSAPQDQGIFPSVIATEMEDVLINDQKVRRSKGWATHYWGNSNRNPYSDQIKSSPYHVLDMSWTCFLMLRWYDELEEDPSLLEYAVNYGKALVKLQDKDGFFPAWLDIETLEPLSMLEQSPETSMSVTFLMKLFSITKDKIFYEAALKAINAVCGEIIDDGRWEDFETYWSCSQYGADNLVGKKVKRNNQYKQCNFSMFWTAEALYHCYMMTEEKRYLSYGQRCLDEMLMSQASWQPPFIHVNTFGGFGVMNCDGEWSDARQSLFSKLIVQYGLLLNNKEYIERGIAALRSSFIMMYCPENMKTKEQWELKWPFFSKEDYGFMMENYGHDGTALRDGTGMGEFTIFDWGNGAAVESYMSFDDLADQLKDYPHFPSKLL
ncbi:hypothetical protein EZV73_08910 [Acidaminobacter sp. JC074]|uniref:hypothetical protein n=1 Tax=Acidaminobacter sp. JC074 TaxID=2530199 RepID=UPI001F0CDEBF|nr:hypothetical protein [Acidaminobacter sp. JC074]MCH4887692.1 hypothetical protein [Acidaminobacter sp. JC074]